MLEYLITILLTGLIIRFAFSICIQLKLKHSLASIEEDIKFFIYLINGWLLKLTLVVFIAVGQKRHTSDMLLIILFLCFNLWWHILY